MRSQYSSSLLRLAAVMLTLQAVAPAHATLFFANTTANIKSFSALTTFCQAVNAEGTVMAVDTKSSRAAAAVAMSNARKDKAYVSATYIYNSNNNPSLPPSNYYWIITNDGVTTQKVVSPSEFVGGVMPQALLWFVLYSTDQYSTGLMPYTGESADYQVLCTTDDPAFTTLPPTTTTTTAAPETVTTTTAPPSVKNKESSFPWWAILILVLGIVVILVVVGVTVCCCFFECVTEDDLAGTPEGEGSSESPQFSSRENRSFDQDARSSQSKFPRRNIAETSVDHASSDSSSDDDTSR